MQIFGLRIESSRSSNRHRKRATGKRERLANKALLDAAEKDPRVMAALINKYCRIQVNLDHEIENMKRNIRVELYKRVGEIILTSRRRELDSRINKVIDRIMYGRVERRARQYGSVASGEVRTDSKNRPIQVAQRYHRRQPAFKQGTNWGRVLRDLAESAVRAYLTKPQIEQPADSSSERIYLVEHNGQLVEMSENEYRSHFRRDQVQQTEGSTGGPLDILDSPSVPDTDHPLPVPPGENED